MLDETSDLYRSDLAKGNFDHEDFIKLLVKNPELLQTPIILVADKVQLLSSPYEILKIDMNNSAEKNINKLNK
jgi:arsenate reductase-like glutaredoxin family protein